jgi:hypothetical protein
MSFLIRANEREEPVAQANVPMVWVREPVVWEYRRLERERGDHGALPVQELNELGEEGWELAGVLAVEERVYFYFKRVST